MYQFISIGGWCGTRIALDQLKITNEPHNIFDHVRSSSKGILDCVKYDFENFLPKTTEPDTRFQNWKPYIGEHFGLYHTTSLTDRSTLDSFKRKIQRFSEHCKSSKNILFVRTCVIPNYEEELEDMVEISAEIKRKYPTLSFRIIFIIPDQLITSYYKQHNSTIFIFCLNDKSYNNANLGKEYKAIYDFLFQHNLFNTTPAPNSRIQLVRPTKRLCLVENIPAVHSFERFKICN